MLKNGPSFLPLFAVLALGACAEGGEPCELDDSCDEQELEASESTPEALTLPKLIVTVSGTPQPAEGGSVRATSRSLLANCSGNTCTVLAGSSVTLAATAVPGYAFTSWRGCSASMSPTINLSFVRANATCVANFAPVMVTVTGVIDPVESGAQIFGEAPSGLCTGATCTVPAGNYVLLNTTVPVAWHFVGWTGCPTSDPTSQTLSVQPTSSQTCVAHFDQNFPHYTIAFSSAGAAGQVVATLASPEDGTCTDTQCSVREYRWVNLRAVPAEGSAFSHWSGCSIHTVASLDIESTSDRDCVANFVTAP